jgi:replicative DNA helicase
MSEIKDRVPPHKPDLEEAVLGACMLGNPDVIDRIQLLLSPDCFYAPVHQKLYTAIGKLNRKGSPVDQLSVFEEVATGKEEEDRALSVTIAQVVGDMATDKNAEYHAKFIQQDFQRRILIRYAQALVEDGFDRNTEMENLLRDAAAISERASVADMSRGHIADEAVEAAIGRFEWARQHPEELLGLPTGLDELNQMTNGFQNTDFIIVAARPGEGKTSLAIWASLAMAKVKPGVFFSLEMPVTQLGGRLVTAHTRYDGFSLRSGRYNEEIQKGLYAAKESLSGLPIKIYDDVYSLGEILSLARILKRNQGIGWIVVDYLQLVRGERQRGDNREQEVAGISFAFKQLAKELQIPVIALCQLSRAGASRQDNKPQLSDLRESGALEQDSDVVIFPHRPFVHGKRMRELDDGRKLDLRNYGEIIVAKQREGAVGFVEVKVDMACGYWGPWFSDNHIIG